MHLPCVLLIDDESISEELIGPPLRADGIQLRYLADASQAVQIARDIKASVVLVDLRMPTASGFDVIAALRNNSETEYLPVIMLSSQDDPEIKVQAFASGATDYLVKWPDPRELLARVRYHSAANRARLERDAAFSSLKKSQEQLAASQAQLFQSQKMEAIGQLTGGIAHDFNNVLQIIGGNLYLIKHLGASEAIARKINNALEGVERGARLASDLLAFARRQPLQPAVVNPAAILTQMDEMIHRLLGERFTVSIDIARNRAFTKVDPVHLHSVLLNLIINARDAMPDGGELHISAADIPAEALHFKTGSNYILIEVRDSGHGMPPEILERCMEPFFTTKPSGQGTGLGLSMAYGFVKQSDGEFLIDSEMGEGTTIRIYLRESDERPDAENSMHAAIAGGSEVILVVEDEQGVRASTVEALSDLGYRVLEAANADAAAEIVASNTGIDLVFTDVVMPGRMTSFEFNKLVQEKMPNTPVLFTSGYAEGVIAHGGVLDSSVRLLHKPYSVEALNKRIRQMLAERN